MGNFFVTPAATSKEEKKKEEKIPFITKLEKLSNIPLSLSTSNEALALTSAILRLSFDLPKPLFLNEYQKYIAAVYVEKSLPLFEKPLETYDRNWAELEFTDGFLIARKVRSGLQYLVDEFKDNQEVYDRLKQIFNGSAVKEIENYIKFTLYTHKCDFPPEILNTIPSTHFWWFYVQSDDDDDDEEGDDE